MVCKKNKTRRAGIAPAALAGFERFGRKCIEPHDLWVMRSYIDVASAIDVLDRTGVLIAKPTVSPYRVSKNREVKIGHRDAIKFFKNYRMGGFRLRILI